MPTAADLAIVRQWVGPSVGRPGDPYDDVDVDERIARTGTAGHAALELLQTIHSGMLIDDPAILTVFGDVSISKVENLQQLERKIGSCAAAVGVGTVTTTFLCRPERRRR